MELWKEKVILCKERKEEIEIEKYKKNVFMLHRWEILREKVRSVSNFTMNRECNMKRPGGLGQNKKLVAMHG